MKQEPISRRAAVSGRQGGNPPSEDRGGRQSRYSGAADRAALRDRIADVLAAADGWKWVTERDKARSSTFRSYQSRAAAVLAVLPAAGHTATQPVCGACHRPIQHWEYTWVHTGGAQDCPGLEPPDIDEEIARCPKTEPHGRHSWTWRESGRECPGVVLPAPADRAAVLTEAAEAVLQASHGEPLRDAYSAYLRIVGLLRRLAAEATPEPATEVPDAIAYRIRAELVCCDLYERVNVRKELTFEQALKSRDWHDLCYWGEASAQIAEGRCPGYETEPNICRCPCEGCKHNCGAHQPEPAVVQPQPNDTQDDAPPPVGYSGKGRVFCVACPHPDDENVPLTVNDVAPWDLCPSCGRHVIDVARAKAEAAEERPR